MTTLAFFATPFLPSVFKGDIESVLLVKRMTVDAVSLTCADSCNGIASQVIFPLSNSLKVVGINAKGRSAATRLDVIDGKPFWNRAYKIFMRPSMGQNIYPLTIYLNCDTRVSSLSAALNSSSRPQPAAFCFLDMCPEITYS